MVKIGYFRISSGQSCQSCLRSFQYVVQRKYQSGSVSLMSDY